VSKKLQTAPAQYCTWGGLSDPSLELRAEVADEALHWPGRGISERADGVALDLLP